MRSRVLGVLVAVFALAACSVDTVTTELTGPETTTTSLMVAPTLPPELEAKYPVILTEGVAGPDTLDIAVWEPDADGSWPIVLIFHGWGSKGVHYADMASLLASQGVLVFAPDYRSTLLPTDGETTMRDAECAYRHARAVAADYGGDVSQPITLVGHSVGATVGMIMTLNESVFGTSGSFEGCPGDVPRPDQLIALSGCHYENHVGAPLAFEPKEFGWTNRTANIHLVVGSEDEVCEPWQSKNAEKKLIAEGFESVDLTIIDQADHFSVMFTAYDNGPWYGPTVEWFSLPNDPGGVATVQIILNATK